MSLADLMKYARILFHGGAFRAEPEQDDTRLRERRLSLVPDVRRAEDLVLWYETVVAVRLVRTLPRPANAALLASALGLQTDSKEDLRYSGLLLARAQDVES